MSHLFLETLIEIVSTLSSFITEQKAKHTFTVHVCKNRFLTRCLYPIAEYRSTTLSAPVSPEETKAREDRVMELDQIVMNFSFPPVEGGAMSMQEAVGMISRDIGAFLLFYSRTTD